MGKGENAGSPFLAIYSTAFSPWNFNSLTHNPDLRKTPLKNIVGKGEIAGNQHNVFYPYHTKFQLFIYIYFVICQCFEFGSI